MPTVRTNDIETYYERRGSGPPLVLVHGAILDHERSSCDSTDRPDSDGDGLKTAESE